MDFSRLILFTVVLSALHHQPALRVRAWDRHSTGILYHFLFLWRGFEECIKQKYRSKFRPWPGFEPRTWQPTRCLRKNCEKLLLSELYQISINCNNFW